MRTSRLVWLLPACAVMLAAQDLADNPDIYGVWWRGGADPAAIKKGAPFTKGVFFFIWEDIQELKLSPGHIVVLTYRDNKWKLGADRGYEFEGEIPRELYALWSARLDQRFVAEQAAGTDGWSVPVKHLKRISGSEGTLTFGADRVVHDSAAKEESRTWRYQDIESISSSGPFQLTVTTYERAKSHYGDRKGFNFQLKRALNEARYNQLWLDVQIENGRIEP